MRRATLLALSAVALLLWPAARLREDVIAEQCGRWPALSVVAPAAAVLLVAVLVLALAWRWATQSAASVGAGGALWRGSLLHGLALAVPSFLALDLLFYLGIGRVMIAGGSPYAPLAQSLPAGDALLQLLPEHWAIGTSAYLPGWHLICAAASWLARGNLRLEETLLQAVGAAAIVGTAWLTGRAVRHLHGDAAAARSVAVVLFCPLAVIEGSVEAHNDAMLALVLAAAVLCLARGPILWALLVASLGLAFKASALISVGILGVGWLFGRWRPRPGRVVLVGALVGAGGLTALMLLSRRYQALAPLAELFGRVDEVRPHCTRSWECLPRTYFSLVAQLPLVSFLIGLAFRFAGGLWVLWSGAELARADAPADKLRWLGNGLFGYFLFLHGWMESWYLLVLLPLLPFFSARVAVGVHTFLVASVAYYALNLVLQCNFAPGPTVLKEVFEAAITQLAPAVVLFFSLRDARRRV